ncbi:MAG: metallophosphoesterase, partial [Gemmataceae bacterium]
MLWQDEWLLDASRLAIHLPTRTVVVADLHLGYEGARQRLGEAIPSAGLEEVLNPLESVMVREGTRRLIIAGDLFENVRLGGKHLIDAFRHWLELQGVELLGVVPGNHDRGWSEMDLPMEPGGIALGRWRVVHGDQPLPRGRVIQGHEHPLIRLGRGVEGPCFLTRPHHIVLPAYTREAAGVNVLSSRRWEDYECQAIAGEEVLGFGSITTLRGRLAISGKTTGREAVGG